MFKLFFISHLAQLRITLGYWHGGSLTHWMSITTLFQVQPNVHQKPRKLSVSYCNVLYHCVTLPEILPETIDHCLTSFFSRNYRFFSLTLSTYHILSQCTYFNFKHINVDWEMLRWLLVKLIQRYQKHRLKQFNYLTVTVRKREKCIITKIPGSNSVIYDHFTSGTNFPVWRH